MNVRVETGVIGRIVIDVPERRNALSTGVLLGIREGIGVLTAADATRVIVLTGEGGTFSSGGDIKEEAAIEDVVDSTASLYEALWNSPTPIIARIEGHCLGLALGIVSACDLVAAARDTKFALPEVRMGQAPTMASLSIVPRLRTADANRLLLTGGAFDGDHAAAIGLINAAVDLADLDQIVEKWASELIAGGPAAIAACKKLIGSIRTAGRETVTLASAMTIELARSPEAIEGLAARAADRAPSWIPDDAVTGKSNNERTGFRA